MIQETRTNGEAIKFLAKRLHQIEMTSIGDVKDKVEEMQNGGDS